MHMYVRTYMNMYRMVHEQQFSVRAITVFSFMIFFVLLALAAIPDTI